MTRAEATTEAPTGLARPRSVVPRSGIGGVVGGPPDDPAVAALARALRPAPCMLASAGPDLVADWDACCLDGAPLDDERAWHAAITAGRLPDVYGAFAVAWRDAEGAVHLARDPIGHRSLYYAESTGRLLFASSLHALLTSGLVPRDIDLVSVAAYLVYAYVPGRRSLIAGIHELLPGEEVTYRDGRLDRRSFWSLPPEGAIGADWSEADQARELRRELETVVRRHLPPGRAVAASLSGGVDSSLVVALARRLHDAPVHSYSIHFGAQHRNELHWSAMVADHLGIEHRILEISPAAVVRELDETTAMLSSPIGDPLTVPNALLFRRAAEDGLSVVVNGEGGDPCFGGPKNLPMLLAEIYGDGWDDAEHPDARLRSYLRAHQKCYDDLPELLAPRLVAALAAAPLEREVAPFFCDARWRSLVARLMAINVIWKGAHHILCKVDQVSAPFGVLPRSPLFDRAIVELALAVPPQRKLRGSVEKYLLKQAVVDLLPAAIIDRPKSGMLVPVEGWFRGPLLALARERLLDGLTRFDLFEKSYLERLLAGKLPGLRPRHGAKIWLLVTLESWLRTSRLSGAR